MKLDLDTLQAAWRRYLRTEPPRLQSAPLLARALAHRVQIRRHGDLPHSMRRKLDKLAERFVEEPRYVPSPAEALRPGSVLIRDWQGKRYGITVSNDGFLFEGQTYPSLSAVATHITGVKRNGPRFFGMRAVDAEAPAP